MVNGLVNSGRFENPREKSPLFDTHNVFLPATSLEPNLISVTTKRNDKKPRERDERKARSSIFVYGSEIQYQTLVSS
ncbi:hypothetical protein Bca101_043951 [Brassica carinata]